MVITFASNLKNIWGPIWSGSCWGDCGAFPCLLFYPQPASFTYRTGKMFKFGRGAHQLSSLRQAKWGFPNSPRAAHNPPESSVCGFKSHSRSKKSNKRTISKCFQWTWMMFSEVNKCDFIVASSSFCFAVVTRDWEMTLRRGRVWARLLDVFIFQFFTCP